MSQILRDLYCMLYHPWIRRDSALFRKYCIAENFMLKHSVFFSNSAKALTLKRCMSQIAAVCNRWSMHHFTALF